MAGVYHRAAIAAGIDRQRLIDTAVALVGTPSPTCSAGPAAAKLAEILSADGFEVERPEADWPESPAVVVRFAGGEGGRTLQFNGHLDTVHLPFAAPRVEDGVLSGSGAADMKGGIAAAVEALRCLRDTGLLRRGGILLTAHDQHEGPWGDGRQVEALIRDGCVGDGVLIPEYLADRLPGAGRGLAIFEVRLRRTGEPVHEVLRVGAVPDVIAAGAELVQRLRALDATVGVHQHPVSGRDSVFVGQFEAGEIYNQAPVQCRVCGTRRWVAQGAAGAAREQLFEVVQGVAEAAGIAAELDFEVMGDAFEIDPDEPLVGALQSAVADFSGGKLPWGDKPFLDDGNRFAGAGITSITHGPTSTGAHTVHEQVPVDELERVARVYALTALRFCQS